MHQGLDEFGSMAYCLQAVVLGLHGGRGEQRLALHGNVSLGVVKAFVLLLHSRLVFIVNFSSSGRHLV